MFVRHLAKHIEPNSLKYKADGSKGSWFLGYIECILLRKWGLKSREWWLVNYSSLISIVQVREAQLRASALRMSINHIRNYVFWPCRVLEYQWLDYCQVFRWSSIRKTIIKLDLPIKVSRVKSGDPSGGLIFTIQNPRPFPSSLLLSRLIYLLHIGNNDGNLCQFMRRLGSQLRHPQ